MRILFAWCADEVVGLIIWPRPDRSRVLVIRLDHIGDFILWVPVARLLREKYPAPQFHLTILANQEWAAFAEELKLFDEVWAVNRERLGDARYRMDFIKKIRRGKFGRVMNPLYSREFVLGDLVVRASGALQAVGFVPERGARDGFFLGIGNHWYSSLVSGRTVMLHEAERNQEFAATALGMNADYRTPWLPVNANTAFAHEGWGAYAVIAPGTSNEAKNWPLERFAEVGRRLRAQTELTLIVCGGPGEKHLGLGLQEAIGNGVVDLVGITSLAELSQLICKATLVIGSDAGPAHFAAAHGVPCLVVAGGGHPGRFVPYPMGHRGHPGVTAVATRMDCFGCGWHCKFKVKPGKAFPCIARVEVEHVWNEISQLLELSV